jgi:serine protease
MRAVMPDFLKGLGGLHLWRLSLPLVLALVLVACPTQPRPEYKLISLQPATLTPGEEVSAYGVFPTDTQILMAGSSLTPVVVPNGLRFTVPENTVAGEQRLSFEGDEAQMSGVLNVNPRVDAVLAGTGELQVSGAGWATSSNVRLELDGVALPSSVASASVLHGVLPSGLAYGSFTVLVSVNDRLSQAFTWNRAAGAVSGRVNLPAASASTNSPLESSRMRVLGADSGSSLIVQHKLHALDAVTLEGLQSRSELPELNATQLVFASTLLASNAKTLLEHQNGVSRVWFETQVGAADGLENGLISRTPRASSRSVPNSGAGQWHLPLLGLDANWHGTRGEGVVVAVVDSGIELEHPDLKANLLPGFDFVDNDATPQDLLGHGTHVAGIVVANGLLEGVAKAAKLVPVRVISGRTGFESAVAKGILWAAGLTDAPVVNTNPAQVINLSLGDTNYPPLIDAAIKTVLEHGVIVVAAAGNDSGAVNYPAALPGVIAVAALAGPNLPYQPAYSSRGYGLWLTAYGGDLGQDQNADHVPDGILSTDLIDPSRPVPGYGLRAGTSMAAPQVTGMAALALSSGTPASLVRAALAGTATDLGVMGLDAKFGYGLVSTRVANPHPSRTYIAAVRGTKVVAWTLVQADGSFVLGNLEPNIALSLIAGTDTNSNGLFGEAGELISSTMPFTAQSASVTPNAQMNLIPADGLHAVRLEVKP